MTYQGTAIPTGVVQSSYNDQMATALAGMLANATDVNLVDGLPVQSADGILVGRAAFYSAVAAIAETSSTTVTIGAESNPRLGINDIGVINTADAVAAGTATAANFAGVVIRTLAGWSATTQAPLFPYQTMAPVARPGRSGCRLWLETNTHDTIAVGDSVYVVTVAGTYNAIGTFTNSATPNSATAVLLYGATFQTAGAKAIQLVEFTVPVATVAAAAALAGLELRSPTPVITFTAETSHHRDITITMTNALGAPILAYQEFRMRINATSARGAAAATATDTFAAPNPGTIIDTTVAKQEYLCRTDANGVYTFRLTHNDAGTNRYVEAVIGGISVSSTVIAFDAV